MVREATLANEGSKAVWQHAEITKTGQHAGSKKRIPIQNIMKNCTIKPSCSQVSTTT